jgi:tetratricopeptide (TPR) repeat protein
MSGYKVAKLDEIEEMSDARCPWRPIRHHLGIRAFGINSWTARDAGDRIINEHGEEGDGGDEELYLVLRGRATFEVDDDKVDAPEGTLVFVPTNTRRTAFAEEAGTTVLAIGAPPGQAYEAAGWELWAPATPHYSSGDYAKAIEVMEPIVAQHPEYPGLLFNLACCESLAGRSEDAIEHLRGAIEKSPRFRDFAKNDSDFDPIREEPAFKELVES